MSANRKGERNGNARLTAAQVAEIRALRAPFNDVRMPPNHPLTVRNLGKRFGVSPSHISRVCRDHQWSHL